MSVVAELNTIRSLLDDFFKEAQDLENQVSAGGKGIKLIPLRKCFIVRNGRVQLMPSLYSATLQLPPNRNGVQGLKGTVNFYERTQILSYQNKKMDEAFICRF